MCNLTYCLLSFQYHFEALFRSEQYALVDNACREYLFVSEFFMARGPQALELFSQIMGKTLTLLTVRLLFLFQFFLCKVLSVAEKFGELCY